MKVTRRELVKGGIATFTLGFIAPALLTDMASAQMRYGWLGRYLDSLTPPLDPLYAWTTTSATPRLLLAPISRAVAIPNVAAYNYRTYYDSGAEAAQERTAAKQIASHVPVNR